MRDFPDIAFYQQNFIHTTIEIHRVFSHLFLSNQFENIIQFSVTRLRLLCSEALVFVTCSCDKDLHMCSEIKRAYIRASLEIMTSLMKGNIC
jgi:hypothetical protein